MPRQSKPTGQKIGPVSSSTAAKCTLAAETMGIAFGDWLEGALQAQLERDRQTLRDRQYQAAQQKRQDEGKPTLHRHEWDADQKRR